MEFFTKPHIEGYKLLSPLGAGGMGVVYRAKRLSDGRELAIKILRSYEPAVLARLRREIVVSKTLNHPNIVRIIDSGVDENPFIAMELIRGETLDDLKFISEAFAIKLIEQISSALSYIHAKDLVHRDIKPSNIMLSEKEHFYLLDFGLSLDKNATRMTETNNIVGTFTSLAPEQLTLSRIGPYTDIYQLGVTVYQLLTGKFPFDRARLLACASGYGLKPPKEVVTIRPEVSEDFSKLIQNCLAYSPQKRPQSGGDLLHAVKRIKVGKAIKKNKMPTKPMTAPKAARFRPFPFVICLILVLFFCCAHLFHERHVVVRSETAKNLFYHAKISNKSVENIGLRFRNTIQNKEKTMDDLSNATLGWYALSLQWKCFKIDTSKRKRFKALFKCLVSASELDSLEKAEFSVIEELSTLATDTKDHEKLVLRFIPLLRDDISSLTKLKLVKAIYLSLENTSYRYSAKRKLVFSGRSASKAYTDIVAMLRKTTLSIVGSLEMEDRYIAEAINLHITMTHRGESVFDKDAILRIVTNLDNLNVPISTKIDIYWNAASYFESAFDSPQMRSKDNLQVAKSLFVKAIDETHKNETLRAKALFGLLGFHYRNRELEKAKSLIKRIDAKILPKPYRMEFYRKKAGVLMLLEDYEGADIALMQAKRLTTNRLEERRIELERAKLHAHIAVYNVKQ